MPTLLQLAYLGGYRDGLLRAETLLLSSVLPSRSKLR
jgi:hypothetical protein